MLVVNVHQSHSFSGGCLAYSSKLPGHLPRSAFKGFGILLFAIRWQPSRRCAGCHHFTNPLSFVSLGLRRCVSVAITHTMTYRPYFSCIL
ncbi:hypothetical protein QR685DRAFT_512667 [Neurospora intermedia]|uniref:Uncharacterized protein n=1 Tax=Neurospora intermedia TaxID=5142 RepID=A0ABR3DRX4_NEUIN